jgi:hypothetical protein
MPCSPSGRQGAVEDLVGDEQRVMLASELDPPARRNRDARRAAALTNHQARQ